MADVKTIAIIRKADGAEIRVTLQVYKGREVLDVRVWTEEHGPTRKGLTCDVRLLPHLLGAMEKAQAELRRTSRRGMLLTGLPLDQEAQELPPIAQLGPI